MNLLTQFIDLFVHLDKYLMIITKNYGLLTYGILFIVIFCETGLVVTPFLPGDSLLFASGALAALDSLNILTLFMVLFFAVILGDNVNYYLGKYIGVKLLNKENLMLIKKDHLIKTENFYDKYGGVAIILARFMPIIRTFAPFVAGIGNMKYIKFFSFSILSSFLWVSLCTFGGFFFGNIPFVKDNFSVVVVAIIGISLLPIIIGYFKRNASTKITEIN